MWQNAHPRSLALWTGSSEDGSAQRHVFDLTISLDELKERDDFEQFSYDIEHNLGVLDAIGTGQGAEAYEGFGTDVDADEVAEIVERFESFLAERGLLARKHEAVPEES
jgi:hypothetical protein